MQEFFDSILFSVGGKDFTTGEIIAAGGLILIAWLFYLYLRKRAFRALLKKTEKDSPQRTRLFRNTEVTIILAILAGLLLIFNVDRAIFETQYFTLRVSTILHTIFIFQLARTLDLVFSQIVLNRVYSRRDQLKAVAERDTPTKERAQKITQYVVYLIAIILILTTFHIDFTLVGIPTDKEGNTIPLRISNILTAILILLVARLFAWVLTEIVLFNYYKRTNVDIGSQYAFNQLIKYVIFTLAILVAINQLGVNTTLLLGGLAALLVGIGLGLQQTFNDFFSGIILLFERSVELGDVLEVDGMVGSVKKIGMRASHIETRENITVVVPNSILVSQNVINWSHFDKKVRFIITLGVAYGSDVLQVKEILIRAANESPYVMEYPAPFIRLIDFANSAVMFELHFWSNHFITIEDVKSDLRIEIYRMFAEEGVRIPFPQMDVWMRGDAQ